MLVSGASFDGDKSSVKTFYKELCEGITVELNSKHTLDLIKCCKNCESSVPSPETPHIIERVMTNMISNYSVIDYSGASVLHNNMINEATV